MIELAMGAPKDTKIFPANVHSSSGESTTIRTYWAFKDSFGRLKCVRAPGADVRTYQTAEQAAQEAERHRQEAQRNAERQRALAEQADAQFEQQREQAEQRRVAEERLVEDRRKQLEVTSQAVTNLDCKERDLPMPAKSELVFAVPATRECWTPWLVVEGNPGINIKESADILLQYRVQGGSIRDPFTDGPNRRGTMPRNVEAIRFKSLHNESSTVTLTLK